MLSYLHTTIATLLHDRGGIDRDEVDVRLELPAKPWVESLMRPTINLFLFEIEEKLEMRNAPATVSRGNGRAVTRMPPRRFDLRYLVCAFSSVIEDEHTLLWRALATLLKYTTLPNELLPDEISKQDIAIQTKIGRGEGQARALDLWGALDLPPRPALIYTITAPLDLDVEFEAPLVLSRTVRFTRPLPPDERAGAGIDPARITMRAGAFDGFAPRDGVRANEQALSENLPDDYSPEKSLAVIERLLRGDEPQQREHARYGIAGIVYGSGDNPLGNVTVGVAGRAIECKTSADGRFTLANAPTGRVRLWFKRTDTRDRMERENPLDRDAAGQQEQALPLHVIDVEIPWAFDIDADSARALYHIGGEVRDQRGRLLEDLTISVAEYGASCKTDVRGRFFLRLPAGLATLSFERDGIPLDKRLQIAVPVVFDIVLFDKTTSDPVLSGGAEAAH